jgi:hypothetical protein
LAREEAVAMRLSGARSGGWVVLAGLVAALVPTAVASAQAAPGSSRLVAVAPERLLDTRDNGAPVPVGGVVEVAVAGRAGAPGDAVAAVVTVTATEVTGAGFVTAWPSGTPLPPTSNLNLTPGDTRSSTAVVPLGVGGSFSVRTTAVAHLVVDLLGYWVPSGPTAEGRIVALAPARVLDTRIGLGWPQDLPPGGSLVLPLAGVGGVPSLGEASAVWLSLTSADAARPGWVAARPTGATGPATSNLSTRPGGVRAALALVPLGPDGAVELVSHAGGPLVADVVGFVTGPVAAMAEAGLYVPVPSPIRVVDTRDGASGASRLAGGQWVRVGAGGRSGIPANAAGLLGTLTMVGPSRPGFTTAWPDGGAMPPTSNVNAEGRGGAVAAGLLTGLGAGGFLLQANVSADLVVDVAGWLVPAAPLDLTPATGPVAVAGPAPGPVEPAEREADVWELRYPQSPVSLPGRLAPPAPAGSGAGRRIVYQGSTQRAWAVEADGTVVRSWLVSGSRYPSSNDWPGTYRVFTRQSWTIGLGGRVGMRWFIGFRVTPLGNQIGFHEIPTPLGGGGFIMPVSLLGTRQSAGCIRQATEDAWFLWNWAPLGTPVVVVA